MAETLTYKSLKSSLKKGEAPAVTILHGEEGYFIDELEKDFEALIPEGERDFDLTVLYAPELDSPAAVVSACRRYPMFSQRQVVIVKEVHQVGGNFLNAIAPYVADPSPYTVLCLCWRARDFKAAEFLKALKISKGWDFNSVKLREGAINAELAQIISSRGLTVDPKALAMLCEFVGTDLSRLYNEVDKLTMTLGAGAMITPEAVEHHVGISKDYNINEFVEAVARHDEVKALKCFYYFQANAKTAPAQVLAVSLFNYFADLLQAWYSPDKSDRGVAAALGLRFESWAQKYVTGMRWYKPWDVIEIIGLLRTFDANSKGNGSRMNPYDLFLTLLLHIFNPLGQKGVKLT